jgi:hypothetical protein
MYRSLILSKLNKKYSTLVSVCWNSKLVRLVLLYKPHVKRIHNVCKYEICVLYSQEVVFALNGLTCAVRRSKNLYWNLMPGLCAPDRRRVCVRAENEQRGEPQGAGDTAILFHAIYYTLGSRNSVTCQPKAAMFLMCWNILSCYA